MKCTAEIKVYGDSAQLLKCLKPEGGVAMTVEKDHIKMIIEAQDAPAMRAAFNTAMKDIMVFDKMRALQ